MRLEKLVEILFIITCFVVIACGGFYLQSKFIKYVTGPSCGCIKNG